MSRIQIEVPDDRWIRGSWKNITPKNNAICVVIRFLDSGKEPESKCKVMIAKYNEQYDQFYSLSGDIAWFLKDVSLWQPVDLGAGALLEERKLTDNLNTSGLETELNKHGINREFALNILTDPDFGRLWGNPIGRNFRKAIVDALFPEGRGLDDAVERQKGEADEG